MNYGIQISASGAMTALYRQDLYSNNLANAGTVGFKPDIPAVKQRLAARAEDGLAFLPSDELLERLGGGLLLAPNRVKFDQGTLETSGSALDLAIQGDGFFVVRDDRAAGNDKLRLTRDGRFTRNAQGQVVLAASGLPLMDTNDRPIVLGGSGEIAVDGDGTVRQGGKSVAQIRAVNITNRDSLRKVGHSLFVAPPGALTAPAPMAGTIRQHAVEAAAVDEVDSIMKITGSGRDFESNMNMIQAADRMMDRAINQLGRVS